MDWVGILLQANLAFGNSSREQEGWLIQQPQFPQVGGGAGTMDPFSTQETGVGDKDISLSYFFLFALSSFNESSLKYIYFF